MGPRSAEFTQALRLRESYAGPHVAQLDRRLRLDAWARRIAQAHFGIARRVATGRTRFRAPLAEAVFTHATADGLALPTKSALS